MEGNILEPAKYKRIVLKLSGESLAGDQGFGINPAVVEDIAKQIKNADGQTASHRKTEHGRETFSIFGRKRYRD